MSFLTVCMLGIGLSMDAFAVSISDGMCYYPLKRSHRWLVALTFAIFQGLMPLLGYVIGSSFADVVAAIAHWIALICLGTIGGNMVREGIKELRCPDDEEREGNTLSMKTLLIQGVATSIDALVVGIGFAVMEVNIWTSVATISAVTFVICLMGVLMGHRLGVFLKSKAKLFGGLVLLLLGTKIFIEHMWG